MPNTPKSASTPVPLPVLTSNGTLSISGVPSSVTGSLYVQGGSIVCSSANTISDNYWGQSHRLSDESPDLLSFFVRVLQWLLTPANVKMFMGMSEQSLRIDMQELCSGRALRASGIENISLKELFTEHELLLPEDAPRFLASPSQYAPSKVLMAKIILTGGLSGSTP